ncbi:MAG: Rv3235 family protein [Marmoricola sp.]
MTQVFGRPPAYRSGAARVTSLLGVAPDPRDLDVPMGTTQGTLALQFTDGPFHHRPTGQGTQARRAELDAFARRFCAAVVEVVGGDRGPHQLLRWTTEEVYDDLVRRADALAQVTPVDRRLRRLRARVHSVHLSCPSPGAAELGVHVRHGNRSRAIAARLELRRGRWLCTALQFG